MLYGPPTEMSADAESGVSAAVAAWSLVHGFATLWLNGNLERAVPGDPEHAARAVTAFLTIQR